MKKAGAEYLGNNRCAFRVWAPKRERMVLHLVAPRDQKIELKKDQWGYFSAEVDGVGADARYFLSPDGQAEHPDPASFFQPEGVHGASAVVDHSAFDWQDEDWRGIPFGNLIFYELHVGTFTPEGTFEAIIPRLDALRELGVNAIELMPVNQFPGSRNWGYDGVYPYAVQDSYGGPDGLKKLVDACHAKGVAVFLDVVYNHVGPEGNYFAEFGPYFNPKYHTPWGDALNFDGPWCDGVREYFANNVLYWFEQYHLDGLRLDAIHEMYDTGAVSIWELTYGRVRALEQKLGRALYMVAESDLNSPRVLKVPEVGGFGLTAQWLDDFHHSLYVLLSEGAQSYYGDYGAMEQMAKAYTDGFVLTGEFAKFRMKKFGASTVGIPADRFVVFAQNHDQVGNHAGSVRLTTIIDFERLKVAAATVFLSPYVPMLFMGEEYAEDRPFYYFVSHSEEELIKMVQEGRRKDFANFSDGQEPPDPQAEKTFTDSIIQWEKRTEGKSAIMLAWHKTLIQFRCSEPVMRNVNKDGIRITTLGQRGFVLQRQNDDGNLHVLALFNMSDDELTYEMPVWADPWIKQLDSKEDPWMTEPVKHALLPARASQSDVLTLPPWSVAVYTAGKDV